MGTRIYDRDGISVKRFYGGGSRGVCYSIWLGENPKELTENEFIAFLTDNLLRLGYSFHKEIEGRSL